MSILFDIIIIVDIAVVIFTVIVVVIFTFITIVVFIFIFIIIEILGREIICLRGAVVGEGRDEVVRIANCLLRRSEQLTVQCSGNCRCYKRAF